MAVVLVYYNNNNSMYIVLIEIRDLVVAGSDNRGRINVVDTNRSLYGIINYCESKENILLRILCRLNF